MYAAQHAIPLIWIPSYIVSDVPYTIVQMLYTITWKSRFPSRFDREFPCGKRFIGAKKLKISYITGVFMYSTVQCEPAASPTLIILVHSSHGSSYMEATSSYHIAYAELRINFPIQTCRELSMYDWDTFSTSKWTYPSGSDCISLS